MNRYPVESRPSIQTEENLNLNESLAILSPRIYRPAPRPAGEGDRLIGPGGGSLQTNSLTAELGPPRPSILQVIGLYLQSILQLFARMVANPSIRAAMVAFFLGLIPPIKALFVGGDRAPLGALLGAIDILGTAQVRDIPIRGIHHK